MNVVGRLENLKKGKDITSNFLLIKHKGHTGEYWPEVIALWTEHSVVCKK